VSPDALVPPLSAPGRDEAFPPPTGRQESLVTVDWVGPSATQVGQRTDCTLVVRNTSHVTVHRVQVNLKLAPGLTAPLSRPTASTESDVLVWQLGTLLPRQEKSLQMQLVASSKGEVSPRAWVTFTGLAASTLRLRVSEPKLALRISAPSRVVAGDPSNFALTVTNSGDGVAGQVRVRVKLPEGLEHSRGKDVDFDVGDLAAGESRTVQLVCLPRAGGTQTCGVVAESGGCVQAQENVAVNVLVPSLEVELSGPGLRYVDRKAAYTLRVVNRGDVPASNVTLSEIIPDGFQFVSATGGGRRAPSGQTVSWFLGELDPGHARQVQLELVAVKAGEFRHRATASSERGFKVEVGRELVTRVEDFSSLALEIAHADEAIEVGKYTTYEIIVTNSGSKRETEIRLMCALPAGTEFTSAHGPTRYHREGNAIVFEPLPRLAPRGDVVYKVEVKALTPGDVRFKALVASTNLVEPVIKTEAMRIYADRP
jgi:uncharacterized repeat protein (TIGR01451 family)